MAEYKKLLISAGGGIIVGSRQARQRDAVNIFIGLGGTGYSALEVLKKEVHQRLRPDDQNTEIPTYNHIKFLYVDTDESKLNAPAPAGPSNVWPIRRTEFFSIQQPNMQNKLNAIKALDPAIYPQYQWLTAIRANALESGAGGIRQIGRMCLMDRAQDFVSTLQQLIVQAKTGLPNRTSVYIHIIAGIGGGTGSGTFIDACYLANYALGVDSGKVYGYIFLPDVTVRIPEIAANQPNTNKVYKNAYAAMQELEYCMNIGSNGAKITQPYSQTGLDIPWDKPPMNFCYLISAQTINNVQPADPYNYAMRVLSEYLMTVLINAGNFTLESHVSNLIDLINLLPKTHGGSDSYCVLGASCARIPSREINTYLGAKLFASFNLNPNPSPSQENVNALREAVGLKDFNAILDAVLGARGAAQNKAVKKLPDYEEFTLAVYKNQGIGELQNNYQDTVLPNNMGRAEANCKALLDAKNEGSFIYKIRAALDDSAMNLSTGPRYCANIIAAAQQHNLLNQIDGLITEVKGKLDNYNEQITRFTDPRPEWAHYNLEKLESDFSGSAFGKKKKFEEWRQRYLEFYQNSYDISLMSRILELMRELRNQVVNIYPFYNSLATAAENLKETFDVNLNVLNDPQYDAGFMGNFDTPLITLGEIKGTLDAAVNRMNFASVWKNFILTLLKNPDIWLEQNENRIEKAVKDYLTNEKTGVFGSLVSRSITSFLHDKYDGEFASEAEIANALYNDYLIPLNSWAQPLFHVRGHAVMASYDMMTIPLGASIISSAARMLKENVAQGMSVFNGELEDRVTIMRFHAGATMCSYADLLTAENVYMNQINDEGLHYYAGKRDDGRYNFSEQPDWCRELPSLVPYSQTPANPGMSAELLARMTGSANIFDRAAAEGIIDAGGNFYTLKSDFAQKLDGYIKAGGEAAGGRDAEALKNAIEQFEALYKNAVENKVRISDVSIRKTGVGAVAALILKDNFIAAPEYIKIAKSELDRLQRYSDGIKSLKTELASLADAAAVRSSFFNCLFCGIIKTEGAVVYYEDEYGSEIKLSEPSKSYGQIAFYQAYVSFNELDHAEKKRLAEKYDALASKGSESFAASVAGLEEKLTAAYKNAAMKLAGMRFAADKNKIGAFLNNLYDELDAFKVMNMLI